MDEFVTEFVNLPWNLPRDQNNDSWEGNNKDLISYSTTFKILQGNLQNIFTGDCENVEVSKEKNRKRKEKANSSNLDTSGSFSNNVPGNLKAKQCGKSYIPFYVDESKVKYPRKSNLNAQDQALYLQLMLKYSKKHSFFPLPSEEKELKSYEMLHDRVVTERFKFIGFVKQQCALTQDRYILIKPGIKRYIEETWQHRLLRVYKYPAAYESLHMLPLVYSDNKKPVTMICKEKLLEMGTVPEISIPKLNRRFSVSSDYTIMALNFPPDCNISNDKKNTIYKVPVSEDKNAETLATSHGIDIVISSSGLKCIINNHPPNFERTWDIPVIVKEYKDPGTGKSKKVVYVDKALAPRNLSTVEKNIWYYKTGVKFLCCNRVKNSLQLNTSIKKESANSEKSSNNISSTSDSQGIKSNSGSFSSCSDKHFTDNENVESEEKNENDVSKETSSISSNIRRKRKCEDDSENIEHEKKLTVHSGDESLSPRRISKRINMFDDNIPHRLNDSSQLNNTSKNQSRVTRSKARLIEKMSSINKSLGQKPVQLINDTEAQTSHDTQIKKPIESPFSSSDNTSNLTIEDNFKEISATNEINKNSPIEKGSGNRQIPKYQKQNAGQNTKELIPPAPKNNISYSLWKMEKDTSEKDSFMKGNCNNQELKILIRTKVDGYMMKCDKIQEYCVVPKLEYQTEFGAECLTHNELTQQWISLFIRPGASLCRVRIKSSTSEVLMFEESSLQDLAQDNMQQTGRPNSSLLGTLYNVLVGLNALEPGQYLLSHSPKLGAFVNVRQTCKNGRYNLHDMYNIDPQTAPVIENSVWVPIDYNIITPFHIAFNRVPGTFPHSTILKGKDPIIYKKKKKNRKKK